ncbi:monooxygenase 2-like, partial [Nicotiana tomentosiformis]
SSLLLFRNNASFGCGIVGETCDKILTTAFASGSTGLKVSLRIQAHLSRRYHLWTITDYESRCVRRKDLLEKLENELPQGAIRYSSKVVSTEESGPMKVVHLADGSTIRTKALIGCDGVNSVAANWLGLQKPVYSGRSAIRGFVEYPDKHGYQPKFHAFFGGGLRFGFLHSDENSLYWFCTFTPSAVHFDGNAEQDPIKLKQFVLNKASTVSKELSVVVERTTLDCISCARLKLRLPWNVLLGNILRNNVCVVGDALHPMTPDLGQGVCSALEDSIVIAKCLGEALVKLIKDSGVGQEDKDENEDEDEDGEE